MKHNITKCAKELASIKTNGLGAWMDENSVTGVQLARWLSVTTATVSYWRNGVVAMPDGQVAHLVKTLYVYGSNGGELI